MAAIQLIPAATTAASAQPLFVAQAPAYKPRWGAAAMYRGGQSFYRRRHHHHHYRAMQNTRRSAFIAGLKAANPNYQPKKVTFPNNPKDMSSDQLEAIVKMASQIADMKVNQATEALSSTKLQN